MYKYDTTLIHNRITEFKNKNYKPTDITIYFDLDNTLALFSKYNYTEEALEKMYSKGYYRNLVCFQEVPFVIETLQSMGFTVKILSSCINTKYCASEKLEWVKFHIPSIDEKDIILIKEGENKYKYINNINKAILIDDYYKNLSDIYSAGGIGIKKTYSGKDRPIPQVENLTEIFYILYNLNCFNH